MLKTYASINDLTLPPTRGNRWTTFLSQRIYKYVPGTLYRRKGDAYFKVIIIVFSFYFKKYALTVLWLDRINISSKIVQKKRIRKCSNLAVYIRKGTTIKHGQN